MERPSVKSSIEHGLLFRDQLQSPMPNYQMLAEAIAEYDCSMRSIIPENDRLSRLHDELTILGEEYPDPYDRPSFYAVPICIEDVIHITGFDTYSGSYIPAESLRGKEPAWLTDLRQKGVVIVGKTVTSEFGYMEPCSTRNPHNLKYSAGGSSAGAAAAVAAGFARIAIALQSLSGFITSASYCGVYGYKPSHLRIPLEGYMPLSHSLDHLGIIGEKLSLIERFAQSICVHWGADLQTSVYDYRPIIGIPTDDYLLQAKKEMIILFEKHVEMLKRAGYEVVEVELFTELEALNQIYLKILSYEAWQNHRELFEKYESAYKGKMRQLLTNGQSVAEHTYRGLLLEQKRLATVIKKIQVMNEIDIWMAPGATSCAPLEGKSVGSPLMNIPWNLTGMPVVCIPTGKTYNNMPVGVQLIAESREDEKLLRWAYDIAAILDPDCKR